MARVVHASPQDLKAPFLFIPQEITDAAIDFLEEDSKSLQAAGLVQKSWYHRTREHLFREVTFGGKNLRAHSKKLKGLLEAKPKLVRCVKQLTLKPAHPSSLVHVTRIIPLLTSLTGLTLECVTPFDWARLPDEALTSLHELMSNPRVHKLTLRNILNMDIVPLSQFHNLRELVLSIVHPAFKPSVTHLKHRTSLPVPPTPKDHLRVLDIQSCGGVLKTLIKCAETADGTLDIFHPTTLKMGTLDFQDDMEEGWATILKRCGPFVENYDVLHDSDPFPSEAFALRNFPKLKYFNTTLTYHFLHIEDHNPLPSLLEELDHLSQSDAPRDLSKIRLEFDFRELEGTDEDLDIENDLQTFANSDFWAKLDGLLAKPAFVQLKTLIITFDVTYCAFSKAVWGEVRTGILSAMSNLSARPGIVDVTNHRQGPDFR